MKYMAAHETEIYTRLARKNRAAADQYFATCMGQDATMDDETVEKLKGFLKNKLSAADHETLCSMLAGEAQDTESPPDDGPRLPGTPRPGRGMDGLAARQLSMQAADGAKSFAEMFPDAARIKIL